MSSNLKDMTNKKKKHSGDEVNKALRFAGDMLTWCQIPFVLLGETGKQISDGKVFIDVEKIEFGVRERHITQDTSRLLKTYMPWIEMGDTITFEHEGVPVEIKVIKKHYEFLDNPDDIYYMADEYKLPNPFYKYWRIRNLIK